MTQDHQMPIIDIDIAVWNGKYHGSLPQSVPMVLLNEEWAQVVWNKTLKQLQAEGGLTYTEVIRNIFKSPVTQKLDPWKCIDWLKNHIQQHYIRSAV
jgi:hypothetical protein